LKNFNFSLIVALYLFLIGWYFTRAKDNLEMFIVFAIVVSPLLWLAMYAQGRRLGGFSASNLKSNSIFSHFCALVCSVFLLFFIKSMGETKLGPVQFFGNFTMGWNYAGAVKLLAMVILLGACAASIWTGYGFAEPSKSIFKNKAPRLFFAGFPETYRFPLYVYFVAFLWALGFMSVHIIFGYKETGRLTIITARALLPLLALLPIAILRLRIMGPASLVAAAACGYLVKINGSISMAVVFVGIPLAAAALFLFVRYLTVPEYIPAQAAAFAPAETQAVQEPSAVSDEIKSGEPNNG